MLSSARLKNKVGRPATPLQLSPRELRLVGWLRTNEWTTSSQLTAKEFGRQLPINGRMCVTVALRSAGLKMNKNRKELLKLEKRGGGRGGNEYRLVKKR